MEFFEVIQKRRSIRKFTDLVPSKEDIKKIINTARLAPSAHNSQMWHFIAICNNDIKLKLKDAVAESYDNIKILPEAANKQKELDSNKSFSTFFASAPVVIAVLMEPTSTTVQDILIAHGVSTNEIARIRPRPDIQSIGAAIENIALAAVASGYGICWCTAPLLAYEKMEAILNVQPPYQLVALVALGQPHDSYMKKPFLVKKDLNEVLTIIE